MRRGEFLALAWPQCLRATRDAGAVKTRGALRLLRPDQSSRSNQAWPL